MLVLRMLAPRNLWKRSSAPAWAARELDQRAIAHQLDDTRPWYSAISGSMNVWRSPFKLALVPGSGVKFQLFRAFCPRGAPATDVMGWDWRGATNATREAVTQPFFRYLPNVFLITLEAMWPPASSHIRAT